MYWVTALVLPWWCIEWQLWCCHGDVLSDSSGVAMVMYWVTALVLPWWQKSECCVWTWSYCSSRLNINMYLLISPAQKHIQCSSQSIKTVKCKLRILYKHAIIKLNKAKIIYVFNPILLTNVFAADLQWSNSIILISINDTFVFDFWILLNCVIFFMWLVWSASSTVQTWSTLTSVWTGFTSLLVWKGFYVCKNNFLC